MGHFAQHRPEFVGLELHSHEEWNLLDDDHQADRRQHALDGGGREDGAQARDLQPGKDHLEHTRDGDGDQDQRVAHGKQLGCRAASPEAGVSQGDHAGE